MARLSIGNKAKLAPGQAFYTYMHSRVSDDKVFYIGKGALNRAWSKDGRSAYWKRVTQKHGLRVDICASWAAEQDAFDHECFLIQTFRDLGHPVVNSTSGGEGVSGYKWPADKLAVAVQAKVKFLQTEAGLKIRQGWSKAQTERLKDPAIKAAQVGPLLQWMADPENRAEILAKMHMAQRVSWSGDNKVKRVEAMRASELATGRQSKLASGLMANPVHTAKFHSGRDAHFSVMENRKAVGDRFRSYYADPENMAAHKARIAERMTPEVRAELSRAHGGAPFIHVETGVVYQTQMEAARVIGMSQSAISNVLHGKKLSVSGQSFRYIQGEEK